MHHGHNHTYKSNSKPNKTATEKSFQLRQEEGTQHIQEVTTNAEITKTMCTQNRHQGRLREVDPPSEIIHRTTRRTQEERNAHDVSRRTTKRKTRESQFFRQSHPYRRTLGTLVQRHQNNV